MSDCEWNPIENRSAFEGDPSHGEATLMVGADGKWHLCDSCAQSPHFRAYRVRRPLNRRRPARVQRKLNRQRKDAIDPICRVCGDRQSAHTKNPADWRTEPGCTGSF